MSDYFFDIFLQKDFSARPGSIIPFIFYLPFQLISLIPEIPFWLYFFLKIFLPIHFTFKTSQNIFCWRQLIKNLQEKILPHIFNLVPKIKFFFYPDKPNNRYNESGLEYGEKNQFIFESSPQTFPHVHNHFFTLEFLIFVFCMPLY